MITVHNIANWPTPHLKNTTDVFCGRLESWNRVKSPGAMVYGGIGNLYTEARYGRGTCIAMFEKTLHQRHREHQWWETIYRCADYVKRGGDVRLWCYCAPKACHCDVIRREILRLASLQETSKEDELTPELATSMMDGFKAWLGL